MAKGFIKLYRKLQGSKMYRALNSKQRDVMIQCLLLANHQGQEWEWNGEVYKCEPGQFITSLDSLKKVCGPDVKTQSIRTALLKLEKWQFLTNQSTKTGRLITIINWGAYQGYDKEITKEETKSQQRANKELTTNKNDKNNNVYSDEFLKFWEAYPKKVGKGAAWNAWKKTAKHRPSNGRIVEAVNEQKKTDQWNKDAGQYIPNPSTWLNQHRWEDEVKDSTPPEPRKERVAF